MFNLFHRVFFSLLALLLLIFKPEPMAKELFSVRETPVTVQQLIALFFVVWYGVGVGICTFVDPFRVTSNGYFGVWIGLIASLFALADCYQTVRDHVDRDISAATDSVHGSSVRGMGIGLLASSIVVLLACLRVVSDGHTPPIGLFSPSSLQASRPCTLYPFDSHAHLPSPQAT